MAIDRKGVGGRPTSYKPEMCFKLIDHMSQGHSFDTFGLDLDKDITSYIPTSTLYQWIEKNPEFAEAKNVAERLSLKWWENKAQEHLVTLDGEKFNNTIWVFTMKCRFRKYGYQDDIDKKKEKIIDQSTVKELLAELKTILSDT